MKFRQAMSVVKNNPTERPTAIEAAGGQRFIYELKRTLSVTAPFFESYYVSVIDAVANVLQQLPDRYDLAHDNDGGLLQGTWARTLYALKLRRHQFMPIGHDAETGYAQADYWTYAVFVCAMTQDLWKCNEFELLVEMQNCRELLCIEPLLMVNERAYVNAVPKSYRLNHASTLALALRHLPKNTIDFLQVIPLVWEHVLLCWHQVPCMISPLMGIDKTEQASLESSFTTLLNAAIAEGKIKTDQEDSAVQGVKEGILLVMPDFLTAWNQLFKSTITEKELIAILKKEQLSVDNNTIRQTYYHGQGISKKAIDGFVIDKTKITAMTTQNTALHNEKREVPS